MQTLINEIKELIHYVSEGVYYYRQQNYAKAHQYSTTVTGLGEAYFTDAPLSLLTCWRQNLGAHSISSGLKIL